MGYYVKGMGTFENEPLITTDERGNRVVQTSGVLRTGTADASGGLSRNVGHWRNGGDRLAKGYDYARSGVGETLGRWSKSRGRLDLENMKRYFTENGLYDESMGDFEKWLSTRISTADAGLLPVGYGAYANSSAKAASARR